MYMCYVQCSDLGHVYYQHGKQLKYLEGWLPYTATTIQSLY